MTNIKPSSPQPDPEPTAAPLRSSPATAFRLSTALELIFAVAVACLTLLGLSRWDPLQADADADNQPTLPVDLAEVTSSGTIRIRPGTTFRKKLETTVVRTESLTAPILPVSGTLLASLRLHAEEAHDSWQFATPELLTAFADWQKAILDVEYQETQVKAVRDLLTSRLEAQKKVVARMQKLVAAGTDSEKDLANEQANLIQYTIQGQKDLYDAENALKLAKRTRTNLSRQLQQVGLEPELLRAMKPDQYFVVAEVPEQMYGRIRLGMTSDVRFFALPDVGFSGQVASISPAISKEKRVANVQLLVTDPTHRLRPGMFAEIGLGVDKREGLLMPREGALHIDRDDYALVEVDSETWRVVKVQIGERRGLSLEVDSGLKDKDSVMGRGAILLKPLVVRILLGNEASSPSASAITAREAKGK